MYINCVFYVFFLYICSFLQFSFTSIQNAIWSYCLSAGMTSFDIFFNSSLTDVIQVDSFSICLKKIFFLIYVKFALKLFEVSWQQPLVSVWLAPLLILFLSEDTTWCPWHFPFGWWECELFSDLCEFWTFFT